MRSYFAESAIRSSHPIHNHFLCLTKQLCKFSHFCMLCSTLEYVICENSNFNIEIIGVHLKLVGYKHIKNAKIGNCLAE